MKDMIEVCVKDDEEYIEVGKIKKTPPTLEEVLDIVKESDTREYEDYIYDRADEIIETINRDLKRRKKFEKDADSMDRDALNAKYGIPTAEGDFREMILVDSIVKTPLEDAYKDAVKKIAVGKRGKVAIERVQFVENVSDFISSVESPKTPQVGVYWSSENSDAYGDPEAYNAIKTKRTPVRIYGEVDNGDVNTVKTIVANLARPHENEVRVKESATINVTEVCDLSKPNDKGCKKIRGKVKAKADD